MTVAVDWDDTLVDAKSQEWLPDALEALRRLLRDGHRVIIHTCRANWPEGLASIEAKLEQAGVSGVRVWTEHGKPHAHLYVDNLAVRFDGDWRPIVDLVHSTPPVKRMLGPKRVEPRAVRISMSRTTTRPSQPPWPSWSS